VSPAENIEIGMEIIYDYKDNKGYRDSFNHLSNLVFGINFEEWYQKNFWDDRYICHSILYSNEIIANISISKIDLILNGVKKKAIQIGTVMTHPDFRDRGHSRLLMSHVLEHYEQECDLFFLFANSTVLDFYPKFDFKPVSESQFSLNVKDISRENRSIRKLDITEKEDLEFIVKSVINRKSVSHEFGVENNLGIFMFYALNMFQDCIYYLENENTIVIYEQKGETLHLYDVVSQDNNGLNTLLAKIVDENTKNVYFHFTPSLFTNGAKSEPFDLKEDQLFIKSSFELVSTIFRAPKTAHA
jgi:GNAT superfamily N-acetyltransferase